MKNHPRIILLFCFTLGLGSLICCKDETTLPNQNGTLKLMLEEVAIESTSSVAQHSLNSESLALSILKVGDSMVYDTYERFDDFPEALSLPVGSYYIEVNTAPVSGASFDEPSYFGRSETFEIIGDQESIVTVDVALLSAVVSISWSESIKNGFIDYSATVARGNDTLEFVKGETRFGYFLSGTDLSIQALLFYQLEGSEDIFEKKITSTVTDIQPNTHYEVVLEDIPVAEINNVVWKNWKLNTPSSNGEEPPKAKTIYYEDIINENFTSEDLEYFHRNADGSYTMKANYTGYTTSGYYELSQGRYCRTELREYWRGNQDDWDNWYMDSGTHILETTMNVEYVGGFGNIMVAQIHAKDEDSGNNPPTVKVHWTDGEINIVHRIKPEEGEYWTTAYQNAFSVARVDNEKFTIRIKVEGGKLYYGLVCEAKAIDIDYTFAYDFVGNGYDLANYFKTGNYFLYNLDYEETSEVTVFEIVTNHF